jgi:predicted  nucleic acid-binding Zn-ribbon protein
MAVEIIKVQIDADTKGAEKNVDSFTNKVKTSTGEFENLNEAIGKTQDALGTMKINSKEFKEASKELQTLKDRLKDTENNSLRFTEALGKQPGVIGLVGQSLEGLRGTMKVFMANPIIAVVAGISAAFLH